MLTHITISQYTVVEALEINFASGLTVVTGETGAGKSIVLDALGLCLGDRADPKAIRPGSERAEIHAQFDVADIPEAQAWLAERDLDGDDELLLRRVINADGRSRAYINGRPSTLQDCADLGQRLIDIHGQHAHQSLLRRAQQRQMLDEFADATTNSLRDLALRWRDAHDGLTALTERQSEFADREQLLRYQVKELDELALADGELAALEEEQKQLENAEAIQQQADQSIEHSEASSVATHKALSALDPALHSGKRIDEIRDMLKSAAIVLDEARSELGQYLADRESDPTRLADVRERLESIYDQARKHRVMPERLADLHGELRSELEGLDSSDDRLDILRAEVDTLASEWRESAAKLSAARSKAARKLEREVGKLLDTLAMNTCRFAVALATRSSATPHPDGGEEVEFLISTNPGAEPQSLGKVASGGELSRISLAIQVVSAGHSTIPSMVFDEVDVGIGGAVAEVVGRLLGSLAQRAQVLCVTHLPQVASQGEQHLLVEKTGDRKRVSSSLRALDDDERVAEIARMLGGVKITKQSRAHAREMLATGD
jgi:DNA repair protein RecN (Recombination protein N)